MHVSCTWQAPVIMGSADASGWAHLYSSRSRMPLCFASLVFSVSFSTSETLPALTCSSVAHVPGTFHYLARLLMESRLQRCSPVKLQYTCWIDFNRREIWVLAYANYPPIWLQIQGIATLVLESPYYGMRRPPEQEGSRLLRVSDLLLLGRSTIEESLCLLEWAGNQGGFSKLGGTHSPIPSFLFSV